MPAAAEKPQSPTASPVDAFAEAMSAQAWQRAEEILPSLGQDPNDATRQQIAQLHMQHERWKEAADMWAGIRQPDSNTRMKLVLCRNLVCMKTHRPAIYRAIVDAEIGEAYRIHEFPDGQHSIAAINAANGAQTVFNRDPARDTANAMAQLSPVLQKGDSFALLSVGDGHILRALAAVPQTFALGMLQPIVLIEPDPRLVLACLLIQDFSGATGPIEQKRFQWYVGPDWAKQYRDDALVEPCQPFPQTNVKVGITSAGIERSLVHIIEELQRVDSAAERAIKMYYGPMTPQDFARAIKGEANRPPRVMLLTTRFSTVLQFSTRDLADAFNAIGWQTKILIEPTPHHRMTRTAMRRTLADFQPDVVFQIDHNRFEHADLFPSNLPFVNWIQDLLPNLMNQAAGAKIEANDFVLAPAVQRWVEDFNYPPGQCMEFRKLTRIPSRPMSWISCDERVVYVSNWSQTPDQICAELLRGAAGKSAEVIDLSCRKMIAHYDTDRTLATAGDVRRVVETAMRELEVVGNDQLVRQTTTSLFDRLNNLLFRQQGLAWAAESCRELGLDLQIYGNGWDRNATFGKYAKGTIAYGEALENLTRSAGANLVLEPFVCVAHQRLLDALAAGGFCLIRSNPATALVHTLIDLLAGCDGKVLTSADLAAQLRSDGEKQLLQRTLAQCDANDAGANPTDQVANLVRLQKSGFMPTRGQLLPCLDQTTFDSRASLRQLMLHFSRSGELRTRIARTQRKAVEARYSYVDGTRRLVAFLQDRLNEQRQLEAAA